MIRHFYPFACCGIFLLLTANLASAALPKTLNCDPPKDDLDVIVCESPNLKESNNQIIETSNDIMVRLSVEGKVIFEENSIQHYHELKKCLGASKNEIRRCVTDWYDFEIGYLGKITSYGPFLILYRNSEEPYDDGSSPTGGSTLFTTVPFIDGAPDLPLEEMNETFPSRCAYPGAPSGAALFSKCTVLFANRHIMSLEHISGRWPSSPEVMAYYNEDDYYIDVLDSDKSAEQYLFNEKTDWKNFLNNECVRENNKGRNVNIYSDVSDQRFWYFDKYIFHIKCSDNQGPNMGGLRVDIYWSELEPYLNPGVID